MIAATPELRQRLRQAGSVEQKLALLKDAYRGRRCFALSCGPSLGTVDPDDLRARLRGELVMAVKQAYDVVPGIADFHLLNSTSFKRYRYAEPRPIVLFERGRRDAPVWGLDADLRFQVTGTDANRPREERLANRLAVRENYDDYLFERQVDRPWGPGVLLEMGLYLAVHLGVTELIVIGWDLGPPDVSIYDHFYGESNRWARGRVGLLLRRVARRGPFLALQWLRHVRGKTYNEGTVEPDDTRVSIASSYGMYQWLESKGVALRLISDRSYLDPRIPRVPWPPADKG